MEKCRFCHKEIEDGAKKCDKCGSYQTFAGRFINMGIPIISIMLAMVSWGQAYIENQEKKAAIEIQLMAEEKMQDAVMLQEEAERRVIHYNEAMVEIEKEVESLRFTRTQPAEFRQKLNLINNKIEIAREPVKEIEGQRYRRIE